jgi:hypothetical protein
LLAGLSDPASAQQGGAPGGTRYAQDFRTPDVPGSRDARRFDRLRGNARFGRSIAPGAAGGAAAGLAAEILGHVLAAQPNRPEKCDIHWAKRNSTIECSPVPGSGGGSCTAAQGLLCRVMIDGQVADTNPADYYGRDHLYECSCEAR